MGIIKELNEQANANVEMKRIADHWSNVAGKRDMTDQQLNDAIGNDLEQLEYSPDQVEKMVPAIFDMIRPYDATLMDPEANR